MGKINISPGDRFGRWTVIKESSPVEISTNKFFRYFHCRCDCGKESVVRAYSLKNGKSKSCGCYMRDFNKENRRKYPEEISKTRLYAIWNSMKERCYCPNSTSYPRYGAKGISMCNEWRQDYTSFYNWSISNGYSDELTIDRIDGNGNYEPSNCRWASDITQANNRSSNVRITFNGETHTLAEWSRIFNIQPQTLYYRINRAKWSIEKTLTTPVKQYKKLM